MRVLKFGGTSVADADRIAAVADLVAAERRGEPLVVVVSALATVTDTLVRAADDACRSGTARRRAVRDLRDVHVETLSRLSPEDRTAAEAVCRRLDELGGLLDRAARSGHDRGLLLHSILCTGERLSVQLVAAALRRTGVPAEPVDGTEVVVVEGNGDPPRVDIEATARVASARLSRCPSGTIPVITGFVAARPDGRCTTLDRGGSDLSASALAAALSARRLDIFTDVPGVLSAPPRLVRSARPLRGLTYDEAAELAFFGAKVLDARTLEPVAAPAIPVVVRSTFDPAAPGTTITAEVASTPGARALAAVDPVSRLHLTGDLRGGSAPGPLLAEERLLAMVRASRDRSWSAVLPRERAERVTRELLAVGGGGLHVARDDGLSLVAVVGHEIVARPWVAGRALEDLGRRRIPVDGVLAGASRHALCLLVPSERLEEALESLHDGLMLGWLAERQAARVMAEECPVKDGDGEGPGHGIGSHGLRRARARSPAA